MNYTPAIGFPQSPYITSNATSLLLQNLLNSTIYTISLCAFTTGICGPGVSGTNMTLRGREMHALNVNNVNSLNSTVNYSKCYIHESFYIK